LLSAAAAFVAKPIGEGLLRTVTTIRLGSWDGLSVMLALMWLIWLVCVGVAIFSYAVLAAVWWKQLIDTLTEALATVERTSRPSIPGLD
jgi:hypothetical protein